MMGWQDKAKRMIEAEAWRCYRVANTRKDGKPRKRHIPYTLPGWVNDLVECLDRCDEERAKAIMLYPHLRDH